jgi:hypothetical protein
MLISWLPGFKTAPYQTAVFDSGPRLIWPMKRGSKELDMDLVNAAVGMKQAETTAQIQYAVAKKMMDMQKVEGAAIMKLLDAASQQAVQAGDALVAAATGLGAEVDTYA